MNTLKMLSIRFILILFLLCTVYQGCINKDCHKNGTCAADYRIIRLGEVKKYLWGKAGSYWIYKNTSTNELDTQICTSFYYDSARVKGTMNSTQHITADYDYIVRTIQGTYFKQIFSDETSHPNPDGTTFGSGGVVLTRILINDIGTISPFLSPFKVGNVTGDGSSLTKYVSFDSSLSIQGKIYYNVVNFDIDQDDVWYNYANYPNAIYYWAKDVGIIKRWNKTENYSWELIDYKIIK